MKKILKNKKGFTLVELLAVIVVLAIIMVIATQQINKTISRSRAKSMISSLNMAASGVKTKVVDGSMEECKTGKCLDDVIDYDTNEYGITVEADGNDWVITLTAADGGQFASADFSLVSDNDKKNITVDVTKKGTETKTVEGKEEKTEVYPTIHCTVDGTTGAIK